MSFKHLFSVSASMYIFFFDYLLQKPSDGYVLESRHILLQIVLRVQELQGALNAARQLQWVELQLHPLVQVL